MVEKVSDSQAITMGRRTKLSADAFDGKAIRIGDIKNKELRQFFRQMYFDANKEVDAKDLNNRFIDEKEFAKIYERLEKAAGSDKKITKKELAELGFGNTKWSAGRLFKAMRKLAKDAPEAIKDENGNTVEIKETVKKERGKDKDAIQDYWTKDGKLLYSDKSFDKEGFKGKTRTYYNNGDRESVSAVERFVGDKRISRVEFKDDGTTVEYDYIENTVTKSTPDGNKSFTKGTITVITDPEGKIVSEEVDKGGGVVNKKKVTTTPRGGKVVDVEHNGQKAKVEYDGQGNTYVAVKYNESLLGTAARFGISPDKTPEEYAKFRELNSGLIREFKGAKGTKVEAFKVGEKIRVPGELEFNDENAANLLVSSDAEIAKYKKAKGIKDVKTDVKNKDTKGTETPEGDQVKQDGIDFTVREGINTESPNVKTLKKDYEALEAAKVKFEFKDNTLTVYKEAKEGETPAVKSVTTYDGGVRTKQLIYGENNEVETEITYRDGVRYIKTAHGKDGKEADVTVYAPDAKKVVKTNFKGDKIDNITNYDDDKEVKTETYRNGDVNKPATVKGKDYEFDFRFPDMSIERMTADELQKVLDGGVSDRAMHDKIADAIDLKRAMEAQQTEQKAANAAAGSQLAKELVNQIAGISLNHNTNKLLDKINENNVVDVLSGYKATSSDNESLMKALDGEYTLGGDLLKKSHVVEMLIARAKKAKNVDANDITKLQAYIKPNNTHVKYNDELDTLMNKIIDAINSSK